MRLTGTLDHGLWPELFPERSGRTAEEIERLLCGLRFTEGEDERRHFRMLAPAGWRWRPAEEAQGPPGLLVSLVSDALATAEITVIADDVPREVGPADWALHHLERDGHTLWASREAHTPIGAMADLLTRKEGPRGPLVARTNMAKDGKRIFTITCQAREEEYRRWAGDFQVALASFGLLHPERAPLAERLASYCQLEPAVVGFSYPASWSLEEEALGPDHVDVRLDSIAGDGAAGTLHASARRGATPRRVAADHLARLAHGGVTLDAGPGLTPCAAPEGFTEAASLATTGTRGGAGVEVRALVLATPGVTLLLSRCGPTRAGAAIDWMVCKRAFEIAQETAYVV